MELEKFATALQELQTVEQETQEEMVSAVEKQGLEVNRFNEIAESRQNPADTIEVSDKEKENFESATKELTEIQAKAEQKMQAKVKEAGLSVEEYKDIAGKVQNDPALQQKLQEYFKG